MASASMGPGMWHMTGGCALLGTEKVYVTPL